MGNDSLSDIGDAESGCSLPPVQQQVQLKTQSSIMALAASHSPNQPAFELINSPSNPAKGDTDSSDVVEDPDSMEDWDRDSIMVMSKYKAIQGDDKSDSESDFWKSVTDSGLESATGDECLTCSDTEEAAVK